MHLLLALVLAQLLPVSPEGPIFSSPSRMGTTAFFEFAPASGAGMGAECACAAVTGAKGEPLTFARTSVGYCTRSNYTLVQCAAGQPRIMPGRPGAPLGILVEQDGANLVLQNSDLSQAVWTKSASMACVKNATDPANVASGASTCTASAATQTVTQALVRASAANSTSLYVKRVTGSGVVEVLDAAGAYQPITASLTTSWKRVVCTDAEGCMGGNCIVVTSMCATSTNPSVGLRIQTSGDAVAVAKSQNEVARRASSPIDTLAASATRAYDYPYADIQTPSAIRSWRASQVASHLQNISTYLLFVTTGADFIGLRTAGTTPVATNLMNIGCFAQRSATAYDTSPLVPISAGGMGTTSCDYQSTRNSCVNGVCFATGNPTGTYTPGATRVNIGIYPAGGSTYAFEGVLSNICVGDDGKCIPSVVRPAGQHIAWIGDSISAGVNTSPTFPPNVLYQTYGQQRSKSVQNFAIGGGVIALCNSQYSAAIAGGAGFGTLVVMCGINDLKAGLPATYIWPVLQSILDDARSRGLNVVPMTITPWANWVDGLTDWTAAKQIETEALNTSIRNWCTSNGVTCVDTYNSALRLGQALDPAYNFDNLHPNAAGSAYIAGLVQAVLP
jgi:lysophospholipase L1-like esterase